MQIIRCLCLDKSQKTKCSLRSRSQPQKRSKTLTSEIQIPCPYSCNRYQKEHILTLIQIITLYRDTAENCTFWFTKAYLFITKYKERVKKKGQKEKERQTVRWTAEHYSSLASHSGRIESAVSGVSGMEFGGLKRWSYLLSLKFASSDRNLNHT